MLTRTSGDRVGIHRGALNLNPLAIISSNKIAQQVMDQTGVDKEIQFLKDHLKMVANPSDYIVNYTAELDDIKAELTHQVDEVKTLSQNNGVPIEACNYMMAQAGIQYASMCKLETNFKYPSLGTAYSMMGSGKFMGKPGRGPTTTTTTTPSLHIRKIYSTLPGVAAGGVGYPDFIKKLNEIIAHDLSAFPDVDTAVSAVERDPYRYFPEALKHHVDYATQQFLSTKINTTQSDFMQKANDLVSTNVAPHLSAAADNIVANPDTYFPPAKS